MVMATRIEANRLNAKKSTGPRTDAGKSRSAQNARTHGLRISVMSDPQWHGLFIELRSQLVAHARERSTSPNVDALAIAMTELKRVTDARHTVFADMLQAFAEGDLSHGTLCLARLEALERYNRQAHFRLAQHLELYVPGYGKPPSRKQASSHFYSLPRSNFDQSGALNHVTAKGQTR